MRKLDDIIPPSRRKEMGEPVAPAGASPRPPLRLNPRPSRLPYRSLAVILVIIALSVAALFYFSNAEVQVTPNTVTASVGSTFTATKSSGTLPFEIITANKIATQSVTGSGTKTVNSKASGTITIYNTSGKAQAFVASTRFASPAGLIFRANSSVHIPTGTKDKPGSVAVKVTADGAGDSYNIGPSSFTVPGLAGSTLGTQVYGQSTSAMTGGASGTVPVVDSATENTAVSSLQNALSPELAASIKGMVPEGYVLLPGSSSTTYTELTPAPSSTNGMVDVREQGTVTAVIFPSSALSAAIASSTPGMSYQGEPLTLTTYDGLTLTPVAGLPSDSATSFSFSLAGSAALTYTVDPSRIAAAVAGKSRSAAEVALTNYPEVAKAVLILRPFWRSSFPEDPASIKVVLAPSAQ